ncbi:MAG: ABC transporter ATP-binding protein/permease [Beijerinckiaceae bacterium]|nr:ABC transporter ATP-binding protein/permease [Beijerinckiaceae bacterium]MCZ8300606.1 ABC transporter ATP-binding protein/permease [Beijerinckiaceae bacterium]
MPDPNNIHATQPSLTLEVEETPKAAFRFRRFFSLVSGFWRGPSARLAWLMTMGISAGVFFNIGLQYAINRWNKTFFDAISERNADAISTAMVVFLLLAASAILAMAIQVFLRMTMQAHWRRWLTGHLATEWLEDRQFYKMGIAAPEIDAPEFRMTDDVRSAIDPLVDFAIGLSNAVLMAMVFAVVLAQVGGSHSVLGVTVPGYFLVVAALYSLATSLLSLWMGRPLVESTERRNAAEAQSRFDLVRIRENAESVALIDGAAEERSKTLQNLDAVVQRWRAVIRQQTVLTLVTHANTLLSPVLPLLIGAPKYLSGELSLGQLMQIAAAFLQVQLAFNWLIDNIFRLAEWRASAQRVTELSATLDAFRQPELVRDEIAVSEGPDARLALVDLSVARHDGRIVIRNAEMIIEPGDKILIKGASGTGKSTLIRAVAGLWPWGRGSIIMPRQARIMFVPQRPYIPNGTLRAALAYPESESSHADEGMRAALEQTGLRHLSGALDQSEAWDKRLSGGEQQRLAFARLLLHRPEVVVLDEATSALDEDSQERLMGLFLTELAYVTLVSVGHRPGLEAFHTRVIELTRRTQGAQMTEDGKTGRGVLARLRRLASAGDPAPTAPR